MFSADAEEVSEPNISFSASISDMGKRFSRLQRFQTGYGYHTASHKMGTGVKRTHFHLMPRLGMSGAIPLLPIRCQKLRCIKHKAFFTLQQANRSNLRLTTRSILILNQSIESSKFYRSYIHMPFISARSRRRKMRAVIL
jgi:hypothetical protein